MFETTQKRPALFLDLDSTVRYTKDTEKPCPSEPSDVRIYPGVVDKIKNFKKAGFLIFGVSNQGGIELGYMTEEKCSEIMEHTNTLMDNVFDAILWSSEMKSYDRKPNPGMIEKLTREFNVSLELSIMVGDKDSDLICSLNAGIRQFFYARDFFVEGHREIERLQKLEKTSYLDLMR